MVRCRADEQDQFMPATNTSATISARHENRCARPGRPERVFCHAVITARPEPADDRTDAVAELVLDYVAWTA
jgi:hypothetical protein